MRKRLVSLTTTATLLIAQTMPCLAEMPVQPPVIPHTHMLMPPMPLHQHNTWQSSAMPVHHHDIWQQSSATNSNSVQHHIQPGMSTSGNSHSNIYQASSLTPHVLPGNHPIQLWANTFANNSGSAPSINLDLSSTSATMTAGHILHGQTIDISVGGNQLNVTANTKLTPAEYLAVKQIELTGQQTLILDSQGSASGGTVVIGQHLSQLISNLVIPQGVTVIDLTKSGTLNLSNITDDGNLYIESKNPLLSSVTLDANNINVQGQGTLSDVIPASTLSSVNNGHTSLDTNLNLSLDAVNNITNAGSITSFGNVNLVSGSGNITNNGVVTSTNGSINIATAQPTTNLNITANGGTFQALNGAINLRDASYSGAANTNLTGGNLLSQQLNINAGSGAAAINVGQLTGTVNTYAGSVQIEALTPELQIGILNVTGDPFISNNAGNLNLNSSVTFPTSYLVATASGSIYTSSSSTDINTSSSSGNGGNVVLAAGVTSTDNSGAISLTRSGTGGDIYLTTGTTLNGNATQNITGFNTSTSNSGSNGGNVTLIAMSSAAGNNTGGHVYLPSTVQITSQGAGSGANGNVTIVAEATELSANAISIGGVATANTTFGTGGGGSVTITVATPNLSSMTINDSTGTIIGSFTSTNYQNGGITLGAGGIYTPTSATVSAVGGSITTNGAINTGTLNLTTSAGTNGNITINANITAATSVTLTANGSGTITTPNNVIATIPQGSSPADFGYPLGVAINPAGTFAYVTNAGIGIVAVINTSTNQVVDRIPMPGGAAQSGIVINPAGTLAYVVLYGTPASVAVINTSTNQVIATIPLAGTEPAGVEVAINPAGTFVYVPNSGGNTVSVINTGTNTIVATVPVGTEPVGIAVNAAGTFAYVGNESSNTVSVINTSTNTVVDTITGLSSPIGVAINPTGTFAYVANNGSNTVSVINTGTNAVVATVPVAGSPWGVAVNPAGTFAYVANGSSVTVSVINTSTNTVVATVPVGSLPFAFGNFVGFVGNNVTAYVPNITGQTVSVIQMPAIVAPTITLTSGSGGINVGVGGATSVTANTTGSATITGNSTVNLGASNVGGTFFVGTAGYLSTAAAITANRVNFQSTLNNGNVTIGANLTGTNGITLSTVGTSSEVLQTGGQISLPNGGLVLNTPQLGNDDSAINITWAQPITLSVPIIGNTVILSTSSNSLQIPANTDITTTSALILQDSLPTGNITIGSNVFLTASNGNIYIVVGSLPISLVKGTTPANVTVNTLGTGNVYFGQYSSNIFAGGPVVINAVNHDVVFSIGSSLGTIILDKDSVIQAGGITQNPYSLYSYFLSLEYIQNNNQNMLDEQIGTRIATDYTPWTTYWRQPQQYPLQGGVKIERLGNAEQTPGNAVFAASGFNANELNALSRQGIVFGGSSKDNFFDLVKGYVLFMPASNINVQTREGLVSIPKGAVAWIMETGNDVAIYDLHDSLRGGVIKVIVNNKPFALAPGKELFLTRNTAENFSALNPGKTIGYRNVKSSDLGSGIKAYVCDFSIVHGLSNVPVIHNLANSANRAQQKAAWKMIKNATILADLTGADY